MGRNMFGPVRGPWGSSDWRGWWGEDPPFHRPVFVLTHFARADLIMGDTTFHFVPEGPLEALRRAREAAGDSDVNVGGGVATIRQLSMLDSSTSCISPSCRSPWAQGSACSTLRGRGRKAMRCAPSSPAKA